MGENSDDGMMLPEYGDRHCTPLLAAVQAAWLAGGSVRAIAAELGKSTRTIQDWLEGIRQEAPSLES